jgi:hypothetical protein
VLLGDTHVKGVRESRIESSPELARRQTTNKSVVEFRWYGKHTTRGALSGHWPRAEEKKEQKKGRSQRTECSSSRAGE